MIKRRRILRIAGGTLGALTLLVVAGWLAFVPFAKEPDYIFVKAWGEKGAGPGQFNDPTGIAVADGEVFVADSRNGRIQVFDLNGNFKRQFGRPGKAMGELGRPMNLTIHKGELYVPEYFNDRIQVFALDGTAKRAIGIAGCCDSVVRCQQELRRLDDLATILPPGAKLVGYIACHAISNWKGDLVGHFFSLVDRIDACSDDGNAKLFELAQ